MSDAAPEIALWDFQAQACDALRAGYAAGYRTQLLVLPTGAGKTTIFCWIARASARRGKRILILVHRAELLNQASRRLDAMGVPHGLIAPGISFRPEAVQVAAKDTLLRRLAREGDSARDWLARLDLLVIDEAHHCTPTNGWGAILKFLGLLPGEPPAHLDGRTVRGLGVTATPERLDGQGLGRVCGGPFEHMIVGPQPAELVQRGRLARPVVLCPDIQAVSGERERGGDFVAQELAEKLDGKVIGSAVDEYRRHVQGAPAIAFCPTVAKAEAVAEEFRRAGVRAATVDGDARNCPPREREARIRELESGAIQVLVNCMVLTEGTDVSGVHAVIMLRQTLSRALYLQMAGRGMRTHPGKARATILDHVGNRFRHGLPDEDREWSLDAPKRKKGAADMPERAQPRREWRCENPACRAYHRPAPVCPACGYRYPSQAGLEYETGKLVLAESEREQYERYARGDTFRVKSLDEWLIDAKRRGYKPGWARHRYEWQEKKRGGRAA